MGPDPDNFTIIDRYDYGIYSALQVRYPDCTNYLGMKILVFKDPPKFDNIDRLEPHFCEEQDHPTPIARFVPTSAGWNMAINFIHMQEDEENND